MTLPLSGHNVESRGEEVAIFWDAENKYENHIRKINMNTASGSVAFIVPLPSVPNVYEVQDDFFDDLSNYVKKQKKIVNKTNCRILILILLKLNHKIQYKILKRRQNSSRKSKEIKN